MNPYQTLGIDPRVTDAEIRERYRRLSKQWHPDRNPGDDKAAGVYKDIQEAYAILSDPERRSRFDATGDTSYRHEKQNDLAPILFPALLKVVGSVGPFNSISNTDVVLRMRENLKYEQSQIERALEKMDADERTYKTVLDRLKGPADEPNVFEEPIRANLAAILDHRAKAKADIDRLQRCLDYLKGCKYRIDSKYDPNWEGKPVLGKPKEAVTITDDTDLRKMLGLGDPEETDDES